MTRQQLKFRLLEKWANDPTIPKDTPTLRMAEEAAAIAIMEIIVLPEPGKPPYFMTIETAAKFVASYSKMRDDAIAFSAIAYKVAKNHVAKKMLKIPEADLPDFQRQLVAAYEVLDWHHGL